MFAIESENIVGYQQITVPTGYTFFTVTFKDVQGGVYDVKDIKVLNSAGLEMNDDNSVTPSRRSRNKVQFQKLAATGAIDASHTYKFSTQNSKGWCDSSTPLADGECTFQDGEGFYFYNGQGENVIFQMSGSVKITQTSIPVATGYSIFGNSTPAVIDVRDIKVYNSEGKEMNDDNTVTPSRRSRGKIQIQKLASTGAIDASHTYKFTTQNSKGWCDSSTPLAAGEFELQPGESVYLYNGQGETVYLQLPSPIPAN